MSTQRNANWLLPHCDFCTHQLAFLTLAPYAIAETINIIIIIMIVNHVIIIIL